VSLGVHFALSKQDEARLLAAAGDDNAVVAMVEEIESDLECDTDALDALHRCLTDGRLEYANGTYPLRAAVLGGRQLVEDTEYTVSYVDADQVRDVAEALSIIEPDWLRRRYDMLGDTDYAGQISEDDFEDTWDGLEDVRDFFAEAAEAGLAVVFTVEG
jgi:hypothetical protein